MRVLLVDDSKTVRVLVQVYLMGLGVEFHEAMSGSEGLRLASALKPDLIIADVQMPGLDGFQLCKALRGDPALARIPVLLLTTLTDDASREMSARVGARGFLNKPLKPGDLKEQLVKLGLAG